MACGDLNHCLHCAVREQGGFCALSNEALRRLNAIGERVRVSSGERILMEGFPSRHVYIVCSGLVKLTLTNSEGRILTLRVATPGDVLGLAAFLRETPYEATAQAVRECELKVLSRKRFLEFLQAFEGVARNSAQALAAEYSSAVISARRLALSNSASGKLANVLLDWAHRVPESRAELRFVMPLTHAELGSMADISRETTTRLLGEFRERGWITFESSVVCIKDEKALAELFS